MNKAHIVIFAGAHSPDKTYEDLGYGVGAALAKAEYITITGGGPGVMRAVNKGAFDNGGKSWGICIRHRAEETLLDYFNYHEQYDTFDSRNDQLISYGEAYIVLPGGLGTVVEALQITQRKKFKEYPKHTPLLFVGDFYKQLTTVFDQIKEQGFIADDLNELYTYVQDAAEMIKMLDAFFVT